MAVEKKEPLEEVAEGTNRDHMARDTQEGVNQDRGSRKRLVNLVDVFSFN
jgi:hypothetical protein